MTAAAAGGDPGDHAEQAARLDPRNVHVLLHMAHAALAEGGRAQAARLAERAATLAPADPAALRSASGILDACGRRDDAIEAALRAVHEAPADPEIRLHLGGLLAAERRWREAADHLLVHAGAAPDSGRGWRILSTALNEIGRADRALEAAGRAVQADPFDAEYRIHRAGLLAARGRYGDAIEELTRAIERRPDDGRAHRALSGLHETLRDDAAALEHAVRAAALEPRDQEAAGHLALVRARLGTGRNGPTPLDPDYWAPALRRSGGVSAARPRPTLVARSAAQAQVVGALILREMRTRFGRSRLGYAWAVVEPISHLATLGSVFALLNRNLPPVGDSLFLFYLTGLLPFLMFGHVAQEVASAVSSNGAVLQLPAVKRIDLILARALLHLGTEVVVAILVFGAAALLGAQGWPADPLRAGQAVLCLWLVAIGVGALNIVLNALFSVWETVFQALVRLLYFASGIYYSPTAMPEGVRDLLAWNPVLQCVEWFRSGFYAWYEPHWIDPGYALTWAVAALLVGLAAERGTRRHVAPAS